MTKKTIFMLCGLVAILPIALIGWHSWDSARNRGFEFGYFGTFNRVQHALSTVPGVAITRDWANHDLTLEEFGFQVTTITGVSLDLQFEESDPIRDLSGQQLTAALTTKIEQQTRSADTK